MLMYINGDSNTAGTELENIEDAFGVMLAKYLGMEYLIEATHGASNMKILRTTEQYLDQCQRENIKPDFVLIGWSEWAREDWFVTGEYRSIHGLGLRSPQKIDPERYAYWQDNCLRNPLYEAAMAKSYNTQIHNLHCRLQRMGLPHLFFNAIQSLYSTEKAFAPADRTMHLPFKLDWHDCYYHPYSEDHAMRNWALAQRFEQVTPGWYHFTGPAQQAWFEVLKNHIQEKNLL